ncbi:hypothetical protein D1007_55949 [Hordeum vulgare]|nr:hypothetical protein D1007_55949 [Hordeum vulgare]
MAPLPTGVTTFASPRPNRRRRRLKILPPSPSPRPKIKHRGRMLVAPERRHTWNRPNPARSDFDRPCLPSTVPTLPWSPPPSPVPSYNTGHLPPRIPLSTTATHRPIHRRLSGSTPLLRLLTDAPGSSCSSCPPSRLHQQR